MKLFLLTIAVLAISVIGYQTVKAEEDDNREKRAVAWDNPIRCKGPIVRGTCKQNIKRYHYNAAKDVCEEFLYSGCGGNDNNWEYKGNCDKICVKPRPDPAVNWDNPIRCKGPLERGPCTENILRYHYNAAKDVCEEFQYSGCGGNDNNWVYKGNCNKICVKPHPDPAVNWDNPIRCNGAIERGPCEENILRYHYNAAKNLCEEFQYSGCGGNDNNWVHKGNCETVCVKKSQPGTGTETGAGTGTGTGTGSGSGTGTGSGSGSDNGTGTGQSNGGYGGITFVKAPTMCLGEGGNVEEKVPNPCPLVVCAKRCQYGFKADSTGCPSCQCSQPACQEIQV